GKGLAVLAILLGMSVPAGAGDVLYASLGDATRSPIGWLEFCAENPAECRGGATQPRDIVMSQTAWRDLVRVNKW
ncbi:transglutaminase-like cysteine peptidase, partial [Streptococcus pneumoniae]|uniref:transglutaminase-like cysteine peptidase n=1 Tax=Streptococcus pneumoniae TaxID=1313 RepID=UPI0019532314